MNSDELRTKFDFEWGRFRKYISAHPLTGFWLGVAIGIIGGSVLRLLF